MSPYLGGILPDASDHSEETMKLEKARNEAAYYCQKARLKQIRADQIEEECKLRIGQVRCFWKDKIYRVCSRSGKILKTSMQRQSYVKK
jgi:hypothetical protein